MLILKYLIFSLLILIILIFSVYTLYFDSYTKAVINNENKLRTLYINKFISKSEEYILNNQYILLKNNLDELTSTNNFNKVDIIYKEHIITTQSLILNSNKDLDLSWQLHDIIIDANYGVLEKINNLLYRVIPSVSYDFNKALFVKSQASNYEQRFNVISNIDFSLPSYQRKDLEIKDDSLMLKFIKNKLALKEKEVNVKLYINNVIEYANIHYTFNNNNIYNKIIDELIVFLKILLLIYLFIITSFIIFNYIMVQNTINIYLKRLKQYTTDILNNNFYKFDSDKLIYTNIKNVSENISLLSKKMAKTINEINVNKNIMEIRISTDSLTKLSTTKVFEQDMKTLFLKKIPSFFAKVKLECLSEFSSHNTQESTDKLILAFIQNIQNSILNIENAKLYRIYGSEFILLVQNYTFIEMNQLLENISNENQNIKQNFDIITKIAHIVSIPFDHYSNTQKLLEKINKLYQKSLNMPRQISYYNEDNSEQEAKHHELEKVVSSIITNNAFTLSYIFDTYIYDNNELLMQEVSPNLLNFDGSIIPIGTFISVAHEKNIALEFDKKLILKAFKYIQKSNITHKLAINISIEAMKSSEFITWLESQLLFDYKDIIKQAVFSITTFAAKNNFDEFINFIKQIKKFDGNIILKRFNYNDLTIEQLEKLDLDYIRVHSDYTTNIDNHKKSILSNITNYCLDNNIIPLADVVKSDADHDVLKSLSFYGTSK